MPLSWLITFLQLHCIALLFILKSWGFWFRVSENVSLSRFIEVGTMSLTFSCPVLPFYISRVQVRRLLELSYELSWWNWWWILRSFPLVRRRRVVGSRLISSPSNLISCFVLVGKRMVEEDLLAHLSLLEKRCDLRPIFPPDWVKLVWVLDPIFGLFSVVTFESVLFNSRIYIKNLSLGFNVLICTGVVSLGGPLPCIAEELSSRVLFEVILLVLKES